LARYDELCRTRKLTGVSANDAHHNVGMRVWRSSEGRLRAEDLVGQRLTALESGPAAQVLGTVLERIGPPDPKAVRPAGPDDGRGPLIFELDLDPYERSLRHVSTHLWVRDVTEDEVREALAAGRCYVAFDWMADPTGFVFEAVDGERRFLSGDEPRHSTALELSAAAAIEVEWRLMADGREAARAQGVEFRHRPTAAGVYRIEAWLTLAGEPRPWILSNPIFVRPAP
jgi:hypothetical protein